MRGDAVSYTHLDVYKRQSLSTWSASNGGMMDFILHASSPSVAFVLNDRISSVAYKLVCKICSSAVYMHSFTNFSNFFAVASAVFLRSASVGSNIPSINSACSAIIVFQKFSSSHKVSFCLLYTSAGDPVAYPIRGALLALRSADSSNILVACTG